MLILDWLVSVGCFKHRTKNMCFVHTLYSTMYRIVRIFRTVQISAYFECIQIVRKLLSAKFFSLLYKIIQFFLTQQFFVKYSAPDVPVNMVAVYRRLDGKKACTMSQKFRISPMCVPGKCGLIDMENSKFRTPKFYSNRKLKSYKICLSKNCRKYVQFKMFEKVHFFYLNNF